MDYICCRGRGGGGSNEAIEGGQSGVRPPPLHLVDDVDVDVNHRHRQVK